MGNTDTCRCGAASRAPTHPCHGKAYGCRRPAKQRFYDPRTVGLAGAVLKYAVHDTWACDDCWADFVATRAKS